MLAVKMCAFELGVTKHLRFQVGGRQKRDEKLSFAFLNSFSRLNKATFKF